MSFGLIKKLIAHINIQDTIRKLKDINRYMRFTLYKLNDIREDLVRTDSNWKISNFQNLSNHVEYGLKEIQLIVIKERVYQRRTDYYKLDKGNME